MSRNTLVLALIPFITMIQSCRQSGQEHNVHENEAGSHEADTSMTVSTPAFGTITGDTIHLAGKFVLFYAPDEKSFESQKIAPDSLEYFRTMSSALMDSLKNHTEINTGYTSAAFFKIHTLSGSPMIITRSALRQQTGFISGDGLQPPAIRTGINTAADNYGFIKKYFFLE